MAVAMAMGFLFYGGGSASFSGSKEATAALVVSLFPKFPLSPTDNRSHIQVTTTLHPPSSNERVGPDCQVHSQSNCEHQLLGSRHLELGGQIPVFFSFYLLGWGPWSLGSTYLFPAKKDIVRSC